MGFGRRKRSWDGRSCTSLHSSRMRRHRMTASSARGFTLLELVVVLAILGMALALVAPDLRRNLDSLRYRAAIRELAAALRYARSEAVHTKDTQEVTIDAKEGVYTLSPAEKDDAGKGEAKAPDEAAKPAAAKREGKLPSGLSVESEEGRYPGSQEEGPLIIKFFPKGSSSGAALVLKGGKVGYRLDVDAITGNVRISALER